jgi:hypothetical protein
MVSPQLVKKIEKSQSLNPDIKRIFQLVHTRQAKSDESENNDDIPKINVSSMVSKLSLVYEKVRNAVDYDEDHLLRKNAIKRILRRQILIEGLVKTATPEDISSQLLAELIRAGYLSNNKVPEIKIKEVAALLYKYIKLKIAFKKHSHLNFGNHKKGVKRKDKLIAWIITLAASEIELHLSDDPIKQAAVGSLFDILSRNITLAHDLPYQDDLGIQIYLSVNKVFLKFDNDLLNLVLFDYYNKDWKQPSLEDIELIARNLNSLYVAAERQMRHPLIKQIDGIVKAYSLYYNILLETIEGGPDKIYDQAVNNPKLFFNAIKETCVKKYKKVKNRLWRSGLHSIIYIFLTKSVFVFLLEIPASKFFGEAINYTSLAINVSFPAFLLFLIILLSDTPKAANTKKIIDGIGEITFAENHQHPIILKNLRRRSPVASLFFNLLYAGAFTLAVYWLIQLLGHIQFNWVSITIFLFFLTFVSFFSFRVKRELKAITITAERDNIFKFIFEFFYMPIVAAGKFLSDNISKVNVFVFVLDFIIEAPFKIVVEVVEDWTRYLKEKKEDLS